MPFMAPVHTPPAWQTAPVQQAALSAPQFWQVRALPPAVMSAQKLSPTRAAASHAEMSARSTPED